MRDLPDYEYPIDYLDPTEQDDDCYDEPLEEDYYEESYP